MLLDIKGDYALFTRPEFKVERLSYDVITPSAARGIIEAVYWKPAIRYVIDKIYVCNEPEFVSIKRNEVSKKISSNNMLKLMSQTGGNDGMFVSDCRQQRVTTLLKNVHYIIEFHFIMTGIDSSNADSTPEKHYNILKRRLLKGQYFNQPCMGCREFPAIVTLIEENDTVPASELKGIRDLGYMLYDLEYPAVKHIKDNGVRVENKDAGITPLFFKAIMQDGVINLTDVKVMR